MATGAISNEITVRVLLRLLASRRRSAPQDLTTGRFELPYGKLFRRLTLFFLVFSSALLVLGIVGTADELKGLLIVTGIFGAMFVGFAWSFYETQFVEIQFNEEGIFSRRPARPELFVPWSRVTDVDYSETMKWLVFRTEGHGTVRVSVYRDGLDTLMDVVEKRAGSVRAEILPRLRDKIANPL